MEHINVVGDIYPNLWQRQKTSLDTDNYEFHYKEHVKRASWVVHIGNAGKNLRPIAGSKNVFMFVEPPEIYLYKKDQLTLFDIVAGPRFPQYSKLPNYVFSQVALPWSIGVSHKIRERNIPVKIMHKLLGKLVNLPSRPPKINFDVNELLNYPLPKEQFLSVITSNKIYTPMQKTRLEFIEFLVARQKIPVEVFGIGFKSISDKFEILSKSSHHLALENSSHEGYWTEKLADSILSLNRTYYAGDPSIQEYFPEDVVLPIDLSNFENAASNIEKDFLNIEYNRSNIEDARFMLTNENSFESIVLRIIKSYTEKTG
jgi:hypothetical protein